MPDVYDIFISYAHIDNEPLVEGETGWVSEFHKVLEKRLAMLLGERVQIWRDKELKGNDIFDETIAQGLRHSVSMISILTPRYVKSEYCKLELGEFWKARFDRDKDGSVTQDEFPGPPESGLSDKVPVFKVMKTPIDLGEHPELIRGQLGYEFYEPDAEGTKTREYSLGSPTFREKFIMTLDDLAQELADFLKTVKSQSVDAPPQEFAGGTVYLASTTSDLKEHHAAIRRELVERGCTVLPNTRLPYENEAFCAEVEKHLAETKLSIHLVGARYGMIPEDAEASTVELQLDLGAKHSAATGHPRLIWMPPDLDVEDERQRALIERLKTDPAAQENAEVLITSVEALKSAVKEKLRAEEEEAPEPEAAPDPGGPKWLYVVHDAADEEDVAPLVDHLWDAGFEVRTPLFDGDERELREEHEENLRLCDAFLVYYGHGNERFIRKALADLKKAPGLGRKKPILSSAVYLGAPESPRKARYRTHEAQVLKAGETFDAGVLAPFLEAIGGGAS